MKVKNKPELLELRKSSKRQRLSSFKNQTSKLKIQVYNTEIAFEALSPFWRDLSERTQGHLYTSNEWMGCWWRHFGKNNQRSLFLITVWDLDNLTAIAPMYIGYSRLGSFIIERRLQIIGSGSSANEQFGYLDDYGCSDFLDFLVDEDYEEEVAGTLLDFMKANRYQIDKITLHQVSDESFIMRRLYPQIAKSGVKFNLQQVDICPVINLKDHKSLPDYIKNLKSSNTRRRFRQTIRAVGTEEGYEIESVDSSKALVASVERLITLHQERWNQTGFPGVFQDRKFTGFFKEMVCTAYSRQWLWLKQARDQSGICALRMVLKYSGRYYDYISGFDTECPSSKFRPGIGLLLNLIEEAIEESNGHIELLRGEEEYKYDFTSDYFKNWKLNLSPGNQNNRMTFILRYLLKATAILYKYSNREFRLLRVQYQQKGGIKMFKGYLNFRIKSLHQKIKL